VNRRRLGMMLDPGLLTLLVLGAAGCPDDPEPASTSPCKDGVCPVDEPAPLDTSIAAPPPAPPPPPAPLRGASTTVHVDEASHTPTK